MFVPKTRGCQTSGPYNLFPKHCLLPTLSPTHHVEAVHDKLHEAIMALPKKRRERLRKIIMKSLATNNAADSTLCNGFLINIKKC